MQIAPNRFPASIGNAGTMDALLHADFSAAACCASRIAALLRGAGRFVDDIAPPGHAACGLRAKPGRAWADRRIDTAAARALAGVRAVLTYADLRPLMTGDRIPLALPAAAIRFDVDPVWLARARGLPCRRAHAMVVAESRRVAEDAARLVELDIEPLPAVVDPYAAVAPGAPRARLDCPDNLVARTAIALRRRRRRLRAAPRSGSPSASACTRAAAMRSSRAACWRASMPPRRLLTVWDGTQMPHRAKAVLVEALGLAEHQVRVIAPDVGGGFGPKAVFHPEELAVPAAAMLLGAPVKWIEDRAENFIAAVGERNQVWEVEAAFDADGQAARHPRPALSRSWRHTPYGVALPYNAATNLIGPYVLPAYRIDILSCMTNMPPGTPTRGAGRPQGTYVMERLLDRAAGALGLARDEIRRRNLIPAERMPYPNAGGAARRRRHDL